MFPITEYFNNQCCGTTCDSKRILREVIQALEVANVAMASKLNKVHAPIYSTGEQVIWFDDGDTHRGTVMCCSYKPAVLLACGTLAIVNEETLLTALAGEPHES